MVVLSLRDLRDLRGMSLRSLYNYLNTHSRQLYFVLCLDVASVIIDVSCNVQCSAVLSYFSFYACTSQCAVT